MKHCMQAGALVGPKGMTNGEYSPLVVLNMSISSKASEFHTFQYLLQRSRTENLTLFLAPSMIVSMYGKGKVSLTIMAFIFW